MKKLSLVILLSAASIFVKAQHIDAVPSKEETAVAAVVEKLRAAMISGNKADLESVLANDLTYGHSGGKLEKKEDFVTAITTKKSDFKTIEFSKQSITVQGDVAIVRHVLTADTNDGGKPAHITLGIVLVLKKQKKDWLIIARRAFHVAD